VTAAELRSALRCGQTRCTCHRGRSVHCPNHLDREPSFSVDERGGRVLFTCRAGCRQAEVLAALRARGLWQPRRRDAQTSASTASTLVTARRQALEDARRQPWNRDGVLALYAVCDWLRLTRRKVDSLRRVFRELGSHGDEVEIGHDILARAVRLETLSHAVESELDEILAEGRL
jgi:hypothetical protein